MLWVNIIKYRPAELKKIKEIEKTLKGLEDKREKVNQKKQKACDSFNSKISLLLTKEMGQENRIRMIDRAVKSRCKHKGETFLRYNPRDDVSYTHRIICKDCNEQIGNHGTQTAYG